MYVMLAEGRLAAISQTQGYLLLQNPATKDAYPGQEPSIIKVAPAEANNLLSQQTPVLPSSLPQQMPTFQPWDSTEPLCVVYANPDKGDLQAQVTIGGQLPDVQAAQGAAANVADQVVLPPGKAAVAGLLTGPGQQANMNTFYVVNDQGRRFGVTADAATKLGYNVKTEAAPVPSAVLDLIPQGPALDPKRATTPLPLPTSGP